MPFFAKVRFLVIGVALAITAVMPSSALAASAETIVSLTFDDGLAGQQFAADALKARGMSGTFYVNSSNIGHAGWLTWDQVEAMQVAGHEIGGHTRNHRVVRELTTADLVSEICGDRMALTAHELRITSFAYPEGAFTADAADVVHGCGYRSARAVGGLKSGTLCGSCPAVEPAPPADLFAVRTPSTGAGERTSLADLQGYVEAAEQDATPGVGWIPIVFHEICTGTAADPCSGLYVTRADLVAFLDWLKARNQRSVPTVVRSVDEVVHGRSAPLPALAAPAQTVAHAPQIELVNASLNSSTDGTAADCFDATAYPSASIVQSRVVDGHEGYAQRMTVTSSAGDAQLLRTREDRCAIAVRGGERLTLEAWYTASSDPRFVAFVRDVGASGYRYFDVGPLVGTTGSWRRATWVTPPMPTGVDSFVFGMLIARDGALTLDDVSATRGTDTRAPYVAIGDVQDVEIMRGPVMLSATASDGSGVSHVSFTVDGVEVGRDDTAPYSVEWHPPSGARDVVVRAHAMDMAGNESRSAGRTIRLDVPASRTVIDSVPSNVDSSDLAISFQASGNPPGFRCALDDSPLVACVSPHQLTALASGLHTFSVASVDGLGNVETPAAQVAFTVEVPSIPGDAPPHGGGDAAVTGDNTEAGVTPTSGSVVTVGSASTSSSSPLGPAIQLGPVASETSPAAASGASSDLPARAATVRRGSNRSDRMVGTAGRDILLGAGGNDVLMGRGGADRLFGGLGSDTLVGGAGADVLVGGDGDDVLNAADGVGGDIVRCGRGRDVARYDRGDWVAPDCERRVLVTRTRRQHTRHVELTVRTRSSDR